MLWILPMLLSSNYIIAKMADGVIPPNSLALGRWLVAAILMLPLVWRQKQYILDVSKDEWFQWLVLGFFGVYICGSFVYIGAKTTSANNMSIIYSSTPIGVAVGGAVFLRERINFRQVIGTFLSFFGVLFIISRGHMTSLLGVGLVEGDFWIAAAAMSWVFYTILQKRWITRLSDLQRLFCVAIFGVLILCPFSVLEFWRDGSSWLSWRAGTLILAAGFVPSLISYLAYAFLLNQLGASKAALVLYLSPVYSAGLAWLVLGESPQWFHWVGAGCVLPSIYLVMSSKLPAHPLHANESVPTSIKN